MKNVLVKGAIALALGTASISAQAAVTSVTAASGVPSCVIGGTPGACVYGLETVNAGSWFSMDNNGNGVTEPTEKVALQMLADIDFSNTTVATGSHAGGIDGTESPVADIWEFFGGTGMNYLTSAMTDNGNGTVDMSGWTVGWNGIAAIPMGGDSANFASDTGLGALSCGACGVGDAFTLDYNAHVPLGDASGFGGVGYGLHLEGTIASVSAVPVPAAVWLFGSGLVGLAGVARRKKSLIKLIT